MLLSTVFMILGFILVIKGADWLINGASHLAKRFCISDLAVGLTVVAFGTSAPELIVNVIAAIQNKPDIVFGNVLGSNHFNLFIILGLDGLITPLSVKSSTAWKEIPFSLFSVLILFVLVNDSVLWGSTPILSSIDGVILLVLFCGFLFYVAKQLKADKVQIHNEYKPSSFVHIIRYIIMGLTGLFIGGHLVVKNAIMLARAMNISESMIGLTIVAAGTSLPELATSLTAAIKKNNDIAVGNIVGSNVFNILLVAALSSIFHPVQYSSVFNKDIYILAGGTVFLIIAMWTGRRKTLDRWEAIVLILGYLIVQGFMIGKSI